MIVLDGQSEVGLANILREAFEQTQAGLCLCDASDLIHYVNPTFRRIFFADLPTLGAPFADALAGAILAGRGIKLESLPVPKFVERVKALRREGPERYDFTVDMADGSWWWVNDRRLDNGWILVVATDISSIKQEEFRLRDAYLSAVRASHTDFLTGLPNRRSGMESASLAIECQRLDWRPLTLALLDLDRFKRVNDTHGHEVGDAILVHFAKALQAALAEGQHVSRIGGEEFMFIFPNTPVSDAAAQIKRMMIDLGGVSLGQGRPELSISFSAGLGVCGPNDDLKKLMSRADAALYSAKANGRGRIEIDQPFRHVA